ncbi:MAG: thiol:disulfide interchange protein DsbA/DsbL [Burkholderiales bacterium]
MNRRDFSTALIGATALAPAASQAQGVPVEGRNYVRLNVPVAVNAPPGKIELIDFFWYGCPHCAAFEPELDAWARRLPAHVAFSRVPVVFRAEPFTTHQRIFYALESMGLVDTMHRKVFRAIHVERQALDKPADIAAFMAKSGVDAPKFIDAFNSFSTQAKLKRANALVDGYKIDGVPAIGIHGRYYTSGVLAGGNDRSLAVADFLVEKLRKSTCGSC